LFDKILNRKDVPKEIVQGLCELMSLKPPGKEFSQIKQLEEKPGFCIYFADPYLSMQCGSSENINGLIRQNFPKETNF
jgi:IS30 family transposase